MKCNCDPGTEENGWHEIRCEHCRNEDSAVWAKFMRSIPDILQRATEKFHNK